MSTFTPVPRARFEEVMSPYRANSSHVVSAEVAVPQLGRVALRAPLTFARHPHRLQATHLDAPEVNIAYNQMLYLALGECVARQLHPVFADWTWADYRARQLPNVLILDFRFRHLGTPPGRKGVTGELEFKSLERKRTMILVQSVADVRDEAGGHARCEVVVGIVDHAPELASPTDGTPPDSMTGDAGLP